MPIRAYTTFPAESGVVVPGRPWRSSAGCTTVIAAVPLVKPGALTVMVAVRLPVCPSSPWT